MATKVGLAVILSLLLGCAGLVPHDPGYDYFARPAVDDPWSLKIAGWQSRERSSADEVAGPAAVAIGDAGDVSGEALRAGKLRSKYDSFRAQRRRETAREFAEWIQVEAKQHYVADGPLDHWATLEETLREDGDDCDGLELLVFNGLRDLGFGADQVFRAIVYRPADGQHHMVTLWFEFAEDPWVIDPTGAMTNGLRRMSEIPGWVPIKVFSDEREFTVRSTGALASR